jgi:alpha-tubulin suppressor-like RCC1 family protein
MSIQSQYTITHKSLLDIKSEKGFSYPIAGKTNTILVQSEINDQSSTTPILAGIGLSISGELGITNLVATYDLTDLLKNNTFFKPFIENTRFITGGESAYGLVFEETDIVTEDRVYTWGNNILGQLGRTYRNTISGGINIFGEDLKRRNTSDLELIQIQKSNSPSIIYASEVFERQRRIRTIDSGFNHTHLITTDGLVFNWGDNFYGQLGNNTSLSDISFGINNPTYRVIPPRHFDVSPLINNEEPFVIRGGETHSVILTMSGNVYCYGNNHKAQLSIDPTAISLTPVPQKVSDLSNIIDIMCGKDFTIAIDGNYNAWGWGDDEYGQITGNAFSAGRYQITPHKILSNIVQASGGFNHSAFLSISGSVICRGDNSFGQSTIPSPNKDFILVYTVKNNTFYINLSKALLANGQASEDDGYLLGKIQKSDGDLKTLTISPLWNININSLFGPVYNIAFTSQFIPPPVNNIRLLKYNEDYILSSGELNKDRKALEILRNIERRFNAIRVTYDVYNLSNKKVYPSFSSFNERQLYLHALSITNNYGLIKL